MSIASGQFATPIPEQQVLDEKKRLHDLRVGGFAAPDSMYRQEAEEIVSRAEGYGADDVQLARMAKEFRAEKGVDSPAADVAQVGPYGTRYGQGAFQANGIGEGAEAAMGPYANYVEKEDTPEALQARIAADTLNPVAQPAPTARGGMGGMGGGMSAARSVAMPDASTDGLQALWQASAQNAANQKDDQAKIALERQALLQDQFAKTMEMGEAYEDEKRIAQRELTQQKMQLDEVKRRMRSMSDNGFDPYGSKTAGVGRMNTGILAAAAAFRGEDPQKTFDFYDNLIDKDVQQQKAMYDLYGEKFESEIKNLERATGDYDSAEQLYRANKMQQYADQAKILADQTQNAETKSRLNETALGYMRKAEELDYQGTLQAQQAALARMKALSGGGRGGVAKDTGRKAKLGSVNLEKLGESEISKMQTEGILNAYRGLEDKGRIGWVERNFRNLGGGNLADWYDRKSTTLWDSEEGKDVTKFNAMLDQWAIQRKKELFGAAQSEAEIASFEKVAPRLGDNPEIFKDKMRQIDKEAAIRRRFQAGLDKELEQELKEDPDMPVQFFGTTVGR